MTYSTRGLGDLPDAIAPDGSEVRILAASARASMAHFRLPPKKVSKAVAHRGVEELWYFIAGRGRMWRKCDGREEVVAVGPGVSVSLPAGTQFQFRCDGEEPLEAVAATLPPWPGTDEAYAVAGPWEASV
jgi:mannose-6-phosphate isomerase-like protein (cupin superfamily)